MDEELGPAWDTFLFVSAPPAHLSHHPSWGTVGAQPGSCPGPSSYCHHDAKPSACTGCKGGLPGACRLGAKEEAGHDAVLLLDRLMSTSLALRADLMDLLAMT